MGNESSGFSDIEEYEGSNIVVMGSMPDYIGNHESSSSSDSENEQGSAWHVVHLIEKGRTTPVIDYMEKYNMTQDYYYEQLEEAVNNPPSPHIEGPNMPLPVGVAALVGHKDMMNAIIARGFDPNAQDYSSTDDDCRRPIHYGAEEGHLDVVKCLIEEHGVDVDSKDEYGRTPLTYAIKEGDLVMVKYLVEAGATLNFDNKEIKPPLHEAVEAESEDSYITEYLISMGANINARYKNEDEEEDSTAICYINEHSDAVNIDSFKALVFAGANVNDRDRYGRTPFLLAASGQNVPLMKFLLANGADPYAVDDDGNTALHLMILSGCGSYVQRLKFESVAYLVVDLGLNCLNTRNNKGDTPLSLAIVVCSKLRVIELLVNYGSNVEEEMFLFGDSDNEMRSLKIPGGKKLIQHLKGLSSQPRTMQDIVCIKIRRVLGARLETAMKNVPLPEVLKDRVRIEWLSDQSH